MAAASFYTALPWYWIVSGSTTQVWSSVSMSYVPVTDTTYVKWLASNNPSRIASAGSLYSVMLQQVEPILLTRGVTVNSTGTSAINAVYSLTPAAQSKLALIAALIANSKGLPSGTSSFSYPDLSGTFHTFTSTLILNMATAMQAYIYAWEQAVLTRIGGGSASLPSTTLVIA